ncbi:unnamed protein product, partial [Sphacelaria rigidula]
AVPGAPTDLHGVQTSLTGQVRLSWTEPNDNNSTITAYEVTYNSTGVAAVSAGTVNATGSPVPTSVNITGLTTASGYMFFVRAINGVGAGASS